MLENNIPYFTENLESIPEELKQFYQEDDGGYILSVDDVVPKAKLDEFRTNNRKLHAELDQFKWVDIDEYKELKELQTKDKVKGVVNEGEVDTIVNQRVKEMRDTHDEELTKIQQDLDSSRTQLSTLLIDNEVQTVANKHSVKSTAVEDVLLRAKRTFKINDGKVEAYDNNGETIFNKKGEPLTISEWIGKLEKDAPHLFQESTGAGTQGNRPTVGITPANANLTPRQLIAKGLQQNK